MRAVSVVLSTAHQDTGLVDYFNYRVAATAVSSSEAAATSAKSEHSRSASAGHAKRSVTSPRAGPPPRPGYPRRSPARPARPRPRGGAGGRPPARRLLGVGARLRRAPGRRRLAVGLPQPPRVAGAHDVRRTEAVARDGGQAAGHAFDESRAELLAHRGEDHDVG